MKLNVLVLWGVALGSGLIAMLGVNQLMSRNKSDPDANTVPVYVAAEEIPAGMFIEEKQLKKVRLPKASVPEGIIQDLKEIEQRVLVAKAFPGDPILKAKLGEKGVSGASVTIPKGMRIATVPVNLTQAHSGMIQPKDRVDVLVTYSVDTDARPLKKCKTVLEYVEVFATDKVREVAADGSPDDSKSTTKNISLLVTPEQSQLLVMAQSKGELHLALRNKTDDTKLTVTDVDDSIFDAVKTSSTERPAESPPVPETNTTPNNEIAESAQEFLNQLQNSPATPAPAAPQKRNWTITIFEKDTKREEVVELPEEVATNDSGDGQPGGKPAGVMDSLKNWFGPTNTNPAAPTAQQPAGQPARPVSLQTPQANVQK